MRRHLKNLLRRTNTNLRRTSQQGRPLEELESRRVMAIDPIISEFQAENSSTIQDDDGDSSDWIEIRNPDTVSVNLAGWYLTDDKTDLTKWQLPGKVVNPGDQLLVFASGKDRTDPTKVLHTNFRLTGDGEYLALVKPDGRTIVQSFDPYPSQFQDQSYGQAVAKEASDLIQPSATVRAFVPTDDSLGANWTQPGFNDSAWAAGAQGTGFEVLQPAFSVVDPFDAPLSADWSTDIPNTGKATVAVADGTLQISVPAGQDVTSTNRGLAPIVSRPIPGYGPSDWEIITRVEQEATNRGNAGIVVLNPDTGLPIIRLEYSNRQVFTLISGDDGVGSRTSGNRNAYSLRLVRQGVEGRWTGYYRINDVDSWTQVGTITEAAGASAVENPRVGLYARTPTSTMNAKFSQFEFIASEQRPVYTPTIGLNLASAMHGKNSSVYLRIPFTVEGDATRFEELIMSARYDDGFRAYLNGVEIVAPNVPIESTWNSSAGGAFGAVNGRIPLRTFDLSTHRGLLRSGANVLAIHGMNVDPSDADFYFHTTLAAFDILGTSYQFFAAPTPGETNQRAAAPPPRISGQQGVFFGSTTVEMSVDSNNPQYAIFYTTDGTVPTTASNRYTGPIQLTTTAMMQARVIDLTPRSLLDPSPTVTATFLSLSADLQTRTSDLPIIIVDTLGQALPSSGATTLAEANVVAFDVSPVTGRSSFAPERVDYLGRGGVRDRGSSTGGQPKPNMAFETWGAEGSTESDDEAAGLLGFAPNSDWVLHAPYDFDRALIRNQLAYAMANSLGRWAPGTQPVEVYLNRNRDGLVTEADYAGVYILTEKIKMGEDRVNIADITPEDTSEPAISGGYMWKIDREDPGEPAFTVTGASLNWVEPKSPRSKTAEDGDRATVEQENWVKDYFAKLGTTLRTPNIADPEGYSKYLDVGSWVDHHLISVLGDNVDALNLSTYLFKDRGKKIEFGPQWDFDRSMESTDDRDNNPLLWGGSGGTAFFTSNFWANVFRDAGFWQAYIDRWTELRQSTLSDESLNALIDRLAGQVAESQERNFAKWRAVRPRQSSAYNSGVLNGTWKGEVEHLRTWLLARAHFMDSNFVQPVIAYVGDQMVSGDGIAVTPGQGVRLNGSLRDVFDDTDLVASSAVVKYFTPSDDLLGTDWTKRDFNDAGWQSGPMGIGFETGEVFGPLIATKVQMPQGGTTIMTRMNFQLNDLSNIDRLILRLRYDDGFVAYLNGTEVLSRNLRDTTLSWNSRANSRTNAASATFDEFDLSQFKNLLVAGNNVLSVRGINTSDTSTDMLVQANLVSRQVRVGNGPLGKVYFTTDGSDPRGPDGQPSPTAQLYQLNQLITIPGNTRLVARNFDDVIDRGAESRIVRTDWSAPLELNFVTESPTLRITEINYHPPGETDYPTGTEALEFVEIQNVGTSAASLVGIRLAGDVQFDFATSAVKTLAPGARAVVVANASAFQTRYGNQISVAGQFSGRLGNADGNVELLDGTGATLVSVSYDDGELWGAAADGLGATLELVAPESVSVTANGKWYHWSISQPNGGTPGAANSGLPSVVIEEVIARPGTAASSDTIELRNISQQIVDISGWYLSDSSDQFFKFPIPAGTVLQPGARVQFNESQFNPNTPNPRVTGFGLNGNDGDSVWLVQGNPVTGVTTFVDHQTFDGMRPGESWGRTDASDGRLTPLRSAPLSIDTQVPRVGPVVISEVNYHPTVSAAALALAPSIDAADLEFIEIHNPTAQTVDLTNWRLRGGVDFDFAAGTTLAAGQYLVILPWNPAAPDNALRLSAFRAQYGVSEQTRLVGGFVGQLNDGADQVKLLRYELISAGPPLTTAHVREDEVVYSDLTPWPQAADGAGSSLQRKAADAYGNAASSWNAGPATPGRSSAVARGDFDGNATVDGRDIDLLSAQIRAGGTDSRFDLTNDGLVNPADREELVVRVLGSKFGDSNLNGVFDSKDLIQVFQLGGYGDATPGNGTWAGGDWNGDGDFDESDLVWAFQAGAYVREPVAAQPVTLDATTAALATASLSAFQSEWTDSLDELDLSDEATSEEQLASITTWVQPTEITPVDSLFALDALWSSDAELSSESSEDEAES